MNELIFWPQDNEGYLMDDTKNKKVSPIYVSLIEAVKNVFIKNLNEFNLISVYIIGSIPREKAIEGISDLDAIAVLDFEGKYDKDWVEAEEQSLAINFKMVSKVGLKIVNKKDLLLDKELFRAFLISTQGLCVYGIDIKNELPRFKPNNEIAKSKISKLKKYIEEAKNEIEKSDDENYIKQWCRKIFKVIIRTSALLVIEKELQYSNDPFTCFKIFTKYYPQYEIEFINAYRLIKQPISEKDVVINNINKLSEVLLPISESWLRIYSNKKN